MQFLFNSTYQIFIENFVFSFLITFFSIPLLLNIAKKRDIYSLPNKRSAHKIKTPTLGGIAIFAGFFISSMIFVEIKKIAYLQYIIASSVILFAIGFKDDIIGMKFYKKFLGQSIAAFIIISFGDIRITTFHGFLGIEEINIFSSYIISMIFIVGIINAFNLIDGIDGLASGLGIISTLSFCIWFYLIGEYQLTLLSISIIGVLIAFFIYNFFWKSKKIFMGDTGSLLLGFFLAIFAIKFMQLDNPNAGIYYIKACPAVTFGILIIPIFDTIRIMLIRILKGRPPFKADKKHLHHYILNLTQSHKKTSFIIITASLFFMIISFLLCDFKIWLLTIILIILVSIFSYIPYQMVRIKRKKLRLKNQYFKIDQVNTKNPSLLRIIKKLVS